MIVSLPTFSEKMTFSILGGVYQHKAADVCVYFPLMNGGLDSPRNESTMTGGRSLALLSALSQELFTISASQKDHQKLQHQNWLLSFTSPKAKCHPKLE